MPTPVPMVTAPVNDVLPSYTFEALNVTVFGLTTNDLASPAKKVTPDTLPNVSVGLSVRLYVPALMALFNVVLIAIVPVISPELMVMLL